MPARVATARRRPGTRDLGLYRKKIVPLAA
jgi:hypothetical protein